jgi:hypothetical protein
MGRLLIVAGRAAAIAVLTFLCIAVFRLGWFIPLVLALGAIVAVLFAARPSWTAGRRTGPTVVALLVYGLAAVLQFQVLVGRTTQHSLEAVWHDKGSGNPHGEVEVFLEFVAYPGSGIGVYSTALRDELAGGGQRVVSVDFVVTADLGCTRGFRHVRIGPVTDSGILFGKSSYSRRGGGGSPWAAGWWWC